MSTFQNLNTGVRRAATAAGLGCTSSAVAVAAPTDPRHHTLLSSSGSAASQRGRADRRQRHRGRRPVPLLFALLAVLAGLAMPAGALAGSPFDTGVRPSVAGDSWGLVEVHQGGTGVGPLWSSTGSPQVPSSPGSSGSVHWTASQQYDYGMNPSVAVGSTKAPSGVFLGTPVVIEVHQGGSGAGPLWYRTGLRPSGGVSWKSSHEYDVYGAFPSVAANDGGTVVEVHQGGSGAGPLWYRVGTLSADASTITWAASHQYDTGATPSVAIFGSTVIEVHQGGASAGALWYRVGLLSPQSMTITWGASHPYDYGLSPSVSADAAGEIREVHQGGVGFGPLWTRSGTVSQGSTINWSNSSEYDQGVSPHIAEFPGCDGPDDYAEVHQGQVGFGPLWYDSSVGPCPTAQ
jgi:hypothetical protein